MIIKIEPFENGGHANSSYVPKIIPDGWAKVPDNIELKNFPFGEAIVEEINGIMTVTKWVPGTIPEPVPEPETTPTEMERLRADVDFIAIMTGVEL